MTKIYRLLEDQYAGTKRRSAMKGYEFHGRIDDGMIVDVDHPYSGNYLPEQVEEIPEMTTENLTALDETEAGYKAICNIRVGDVVRIYYSHDDFDENNPFTVTVTGVEHDRGYHRFKNRWRESAPLIRWEPRPCDYMNLTGEKQMETARCSAHHVVRIESKAPYQSPSTPRNTLWGHDYNDMDGWMPKYQNTQLRIMEYISPLNLAIYYLKRQPMLTIFGLNENRFHALWEKAGRPGFKFYYKQSVSRFHRADDYPGDIVLNVKKFRAWVLKNYQRFMLTKSELRQRLIDSAIADEESYYKDLENDRELKIDYSDDSDDSDDDEIDYMDERW